MDREISAFAHGVENMVSDELISQSAAQDAQNWYSQDAKIQLIPGKTPLGSLGSAGSVTGQHYGYRADGTKVHWRKIGTKIQYLNGTTWTDVVTGLTSTADYSFSNYSSIAGTFTFAMGADGIYKMHNGSPTSAIAMYSATKNYKGKGFINKGAMFLWDESHGKTTLYRSKIDAQLVGTNYTQVYGENLGTFGSSTYSGTFAQLSGTRNVFGGLIAGTKDAGTVVTAITQQSGASITAAGHTFAVGDYVLVFGAAGMTEINGVLGRVTSVTATTFQTDIDSSAYGVYTSGARAYQVEVFTDNNNGVMIGAAGGTGTINYITGAYSVTFNTAVTAGNVYGLYYYEDSNVSGVTDFTYSGTRTAGQGIVLKQDEGGDAILNVLIGPDGYYSMKSNSVYKLNIDSTDLVLTNNVYRKQLGIPSWRACLSTSQGIIFMNTANPEKPEMTILEPNIASDALVPKVLFPLFKFSNYVFDDCTIDTYDRYILVACKTKNAVANDTILLCNPTAKTVDIVRYSARVFTNNAGYLYGGSSLSETTYQLFTGYDDDGFAIDNYWIGKGETFAVQQGDETGNSLKKERRIRLQGHISADQSYEVYISFDGADPTLVGTVLGSGSYVDYGSPVTIGGNEVGGTQIGGDPITDVYPYLVEIRLKKIPKFRKRAIKLIALGLGYVSVERQLDVDIDVYEGKIPDRFRLKQNVSLDGTQVDVAN